MLDLVQRLKDSCAVIKQAKTWWCYSVRLQLQRNQRAQSHHHVDLLRQLLLHMIASLHVKVTLIHQPCANWGICATYVCNILKLCSSTALSCISLFFYEDVEMWFFLKALPDWNLLLCRSYNLVSHVFFCFCGRALLFWWWIQWCNNLEGPGTAWI
jgi:hypothetical protein